MTTIVLALLPWVVVWLGIDVLRSAIASFVLYHGVCLLAFAAFRPRANAAKPLPIPAVGWISLCAVSLPTCGVAYFGSGAIALLSNPCTVRHELVDLGFHGDLGAYALLFLYFSLVNPVAEELFWRGTIYTRLVASGWRPQSAVAVSSILFGSWHWLVLVHFFGPALALLATVGVAAFGAVFAIVYSRTRSLPAIVLLHALGADIPVLIYLAHGVLSRGYG